MKRTAKTPIELICVFAGRTVILLIMSCCDSNVTIGSNLKLKNKTWVSFQWRLAGSFSCIEELDQSRINGNGLNF